jgi:hypothetical protein
MLIKGIIRENTKRNGASGLVERPRIFWRSAVIWLHECWVKALLGYLLRALGGEFKGARLFLVNTTWAMWFPAAMARKYLAEPLEGVSKFYSAIWNEPAANGGRNVYVVTCAQTRT